MDESLTNVNNFTLNLLIGFIVSAGIGFLIGLERQYSKEVQEGEEQFAGIRTFTMVCIAGFICALLSKHFGPWVFVVGLLALSAMLVASYIRLSVNHDERGGTTEVATLITFLLGGLVYLNYILISLAVMVMMLALLAFKPGLHGFAKKLTRNELLSIILFVVMSALVIPFLPAKSFGPYGLWNLKEIWKMVILVSGTSLVGYMIAKIMGNKGTIVAGIVGGLVSSTSVALAFSKRSKDAESNGAVYLAIAILGACTIMFPRILFEVFVVNPQLGEKMVLPLSVLTAAGAAGAFLIYKRQRKKSAGEDLPLKNPLNLSTAIKFALFFAGVQWLVYYSQQNFGASGTYIAGAVSGITDVDAITLSMAKMAKSGDHQLSINTILIAALSNTLVKFSIALVLGSPQLKKAVSIGFGVIFLAGAALFVFSMF